MNQLTGLGFDDGDGRRRRRQRRRALGFDDDAEVLTAALQMLQFITLAYIAHYQPVSAPSVLLINHPLTDDSIENDAIVSIAMTNRQFVFKLTLINYIVAPYTS